MIIEEGFSIDSLRQIAQSLKVAADVAGVKIVTGDMKVVHRGAAEKLFINTAGVGAPALISRPKISNQGMSSLLMDISVITVQQLRLPVET